MTLAVSGLEVAYDAFRLGPIDLGVEDEVLCVLGPSGCGKTTLLSAIAGIVPADAGTVSLDGRNLAGLPPERRGTALVFQDGALFPHLSARENIAYATPDGAAVSDLAETLAVDDVLSQPAATLSGGEGTRVALARALAAEPDALLLDEPLSGLDAPIKRRLGDDLRDLLSSLPIPVVHVTHDQRAAASIGDRIAVMRDGRFSQIDTPRTVFSRPATPFVARFTGSANVFPARVDEEGRLRWVGRTLDVGGGKDPTPGDRVWFSVRPTSVRVGSGPAAVGASSDSSVEGENVVTGAVVNRVFEGDAYRVSVRPRGGEVSVEVAVLPSTYDRLDIASRDRLALNLPPSAVHVIPPADRSAGG